MIPNVDEQQLLKELTLKHLGGIKPEAPWIKRCGAGIKFTDEIQETDFNIEPDSVKNDDKLKHGKSITDLLLNIEIEELPSEMVNSPQDPRPIKRVLSEQIMHRTNKSIEETFALKEQLYLDNDMDNDDNPHKVSIIDESRLEF